MATIYFNDGTTAEVENVKGHDPRTFAIPAASYAAIANAWMSQAVARFSEGGETYLLTRLQGDRGTAVLQYTRERR